MSGTAGLFLSATDPSTAWAVIGTSTPAATVYNYTDADGNWRAYKFLTSGTVAVLTAGKIEYLSVGGGGGGSSVGLSGGGGGGGGGGFVTGTFVALKTTGLVIRVGTGGEAGEPGNFGEPGRESFIQGGIVATGGGGGDAGNAVPRHGIMNGGSGAGATGAINNAQGGLSSFGNGFPGANSLWTTTGGNKYWAGSGGGAGEAGVLPATTGTPGRGGNGKQSAITGTNLYYAGGGGGGSQAGGGLYQAGGLGGGGRGGYINVDPPQPGVDGTGGGGGGRYGTSPLTTLNKGGSGVVIIRVKV